MHFASHHGDRIAFRRDGSGPVLVLIHGTGGDSEANWSELVAPLAEHFTLIRPDYSGSGATTDDGRVLTPEDLAGQVLAAVDAAEADTFSLVGFSLGAGIAAMLAAALPARVRSLALVAGFAAPDPRLRMQFELWRDLIATDRRAMARLILLTGLGPDTVAGMPLEALAESIDDMVRTMNWEGMTRQVEVDLGLDVSEVLPRIGVPTLSVGCLHDHMVPPAHARHLAATIPGARYTELPTGHLAPMEAPGLLAGELIAFLRETAA